jgi:hypothetical protein
VDENGFIALPDGTSAPVLVRPDGTAYVQDAAGELILIGEGASFITGLGATQEVAQEAAPEAQPPAGETVSEPVVAEQPVAEEPVVAEPVTPAA